MRSARWTPISLRYKPANSTTSRAAVATLPKMLRPSQNRLYAVFVRNYQQRQCPTDQGVHARAERLGDGPEDPVPGRH